MVLRASMISVALTLSFTSVGFADTPKKTTPSGSASSAPKKDAPPASSGIKKTDPPNPTGPAK
jgi:hypothetical protein